MTLLEGIAVMTAIAVAAYIIYQRVAAAIRLRRLRDKNRVYRIVESLRARQQENVAFYGAPKTPDAGKAVYLDDQGRAHQWTDGEDAFLRMIERKKEAITRMLMVEKNPVVTVETWPTQNEDLDPPLTREEMDMLQENARTQRHEPLRKRLDEGNKP